ncbi:hypothetical protein QNH36_01600 [Mesobacillus sp. AQ2]|jgi:hypothetical protein|uniref:hypothetical protein n=1 Tax=Bacillaceae TaxID=186817 RepID=UPI0011A380D0|nr:MULTISPECIES: hypothetical protein [Bacillaceae]MCM3125800.1 hypothetical protein [Mesobacillus sp. MER 33]MCM3235821.1 hypothetical protein [Mesobacillus sp. MER 48]WHX40887.1 hypothetical protein QNH36_01600 [Mesobacillus sp. AQ2]
MHVLDLIARINNRVEELDFAAARLYMEENIEILNENRSHLKSNARELLEFLTKRMEAGQQPLTRKDMAVINAVNNYASKFDLRGLKVVIKDHSLLFLRSDIESYLNTDARIILEGMGAIPKAAS